MLAKLFPFIAWFRNYDGNSLKTDAVAGLTVALVLIPQSMAYAQLAGLPAYYGLYASFLPPMVAALFGSSRQLATGPVAVVSLMTAASLEPLATAGSSGYIVYAVVLALMVGVFQLALGVLRLGLVVNFLSHPVVNGFTNAAAIIIASSQLSKMFGVDVDSAAHHYETIWRVIQGAVHYTHWPTLFMGALAFGVMYGLKAISPRIPNVLVAVVLTTLISWVIGFRHDQTVDLDAVASPAVHELVERFNGAALGIADLGRQRTQVSEQLAEASSGHDAIGMIKARHDSSVITVNMERLKEDAQPAFQRCCPAGRKSGFLPEGRGARRYPDRRPQMAHQSG
jgi:sulfate permease, SulP family